MHCKTRQGNAIGMQCLAANGGRGQAAQQPQGRQTAAEEAGSALECCATPLSNTIASLYLLLTTGGKKFSGLEA